MKEGAFVAEKFMDILNNVGEGVSAAAPGLSLSKILSDVGAEVSRLGDQGRSEIAAALFNNNGFVLYGPGQDISKHEEKAVEAPAIEIEEQKRSGREL
jgi:hypothetical protein